MNSNKQRSSAYELNDHREMDLRVCMLCVVTNVSGRVLTVRPAYNERVMDETGRGVSYAPMGEIIDVPMPVIMQIEYQMEAGDHGLLIFSDTATDGYISADGVADLDGQSRFHDYADALFIPCDFRRDNAKQPIMRIRNGRIEVDDIIVDGKSVKDHVHRDSRGRLTSTMI